jgi:neopullulanase
MLRGDAEALKLLLLMQACVPGPPMVYQGTEVGQIGALGLDGSGRDPHNRQAFPWHESVAWDRNLLSHSKEVGRLRNELYALRRGGLRWCVTHSEIANEGEPVDDTKLIAWERAFASSSDGAGAVCAFHSDKNKTTSATLIDTGFGANVPVKAAFATKGVVLGSATDAEGRVSVTFPPQSGVVVVPA